MFSDKNRLKLERYQAQAAMYVRCADEAVSMGSLESAASNLTEALDRVTKILDIVVRRVDRI